MKKSKKIITIIFSILMSISSLTLFKLNSNFHKAVAESEDISIETVSEVMTLSNPTRQHFNVFFSKNISSEDVFGIADSTSPTYNPDLLNHIILNGNSLKWINDNGVNLRGEPVINGVSVNLYSNGDPNNLKYGIHFFFDEKLAKNYSGESYKLKLDDTDTVIFKAGLKYGDFELTKDLSMTYYHSILDWKKEGDLMDFEANSLKNISAPTYESTQKLIYFYLKFDRNAADKFIGYAVYDRILENILFNGKSLKELNHDYGDNSCFVRFQTGKSMLIDDEDYYLYIHIKNNVFNNRTSLNENDEITIKKELRLPSLATLDKDYTYYYAAKDNFWVSRKDVAYDYISVSPVDISNIVFDSNSGNYYFVLYFDQPISYHYLPQVNAELDWLEFVYNEASPAFYYSHSYLEALVYDHIRSSALDYICINGKTIRELCEMEDDTVIRKDQSLVINYCGTPFDATAIQFLFNGQGVNRYIDGERYEITIKKGFITPLHGIVNEDTTLVLGQGLLKPSDTNQNQKATIPTFVFIVSPIALVIAISLVVFFVIRRKKHE